ncbi:MAG TPA: polysaccharide deacetylase family protein [Candidatus Eisenbacteria bacterium]|nr:polysaccharide deacetylase family protein [Candidatus Eisenbacteria bacterium]
MSTSRLSGVVFTGLAIVLISGNSFPNALSISSLESKARLDYVSSVKLIDNIVSDRSNKVVMINFDDGRKSQLIYAKPILDEYGFKASFFIICGRVGTERSSMNWQDIAQLKKDGMGIESHSMTHTNLNRLSTNALNFEIGGQCFAKHGYNTPLFGYPFNLGSNEPSVVNWVAKYYNFGRSGTDRLMLLDCRGYMKDTQADCRTYLPNGMLTHANRYDIRSASFYHVSNQHNFTPQEMFHVFLQIVNGATQYNSIGKISAIPIIVYHNITNSIRDYTIPSHASSTTLDLFAQEMKYLHNNGFRVLLLNQLGYEPISNVFYSPPPSAAALP